mmetsp:Transcript_8539/g.28108  ORF Transcript_8539/g.28108 Transcript_8539/m.28108 type:complete len:205 (+) Transcript_8539:1384-1998(+)
MRAASNAKKRQDFVLARAIARTMHNAKANLAVDAALRRSASATVGSPFSLARRASEMATKTSHGPSRTTKERGTHRGSHSTPESRNDILISASSRMRRCDKRAVASTAFCCLTNCAVIAFFDLAAARRTSSFLAPFASSMSVSSCSNFESTFIGFLTRFFGAGASLSSAAVFGGGAAAAAWSGHGSSLASLAPTASCMSGHAPA